MQNITDSESRGSFNIETLIFEDWVIIPECLDLLILVLAVYGMYQGIEILHPLYAVLFADLILPIIFTIINITSFSFITPIRFLVLSNSGNTFCLYFHCCCWCVTSILRYIYILHEHWIHKVWPKSKFQCLVALLLTLAMTVCCMMPMFSYGIYLGEICCVFTNKIFYVMLGVRFG